MSGPHPISLSSEYRGLTRPWVQELSSMPDHLQTGTSAFFWPFVLKGHLSSSWVLSLPLHMRVELHCGHSWASGLPARPQNAGLVSLRNHTSQFLTINLFMYFIHVFYIYVYISYWLDCFREPWQINIHEIVNSGEKWEGWGKGTRCVFVLGGGYLKQFLQIVYITFIIIIKHKI